MKFEKIHRKGCIPTENAKEIVLTQMKADLKNDWFISEKGKAKTNQRKNGKKKAKHFDDVQTTTYQKHGAILDRWMDVTIPGLSATITVTVPATLAFTKVTSTLFHTEEGQTHRVVQLQTQQPVFQNSEHPHLHFGQEYWVLDEEECNICDFNWNLSTFQAKSNVELPNDIEDPFDRQNFKLRS